MYYISLEWLIILWNKILLNSDILNCLGVNLKKIFIFRNKKCFYKFFFSKVLGVRNFNMFCKNFFIMIFKGKKEK